MSALDERATRIISGKSTLEKELKTASTTEALALCLIMERTDLLADPDPLAAWLRLDERQRSSVGHHNRTMGFGMRVAADDLAATLAPK